MPRRDRGSGVEHTNRLIDEKSPYLLQHARNPVDWYPWGPEAFAEAKRRDRPIFLSVGYSTCYWCHVMERESFENEDIAQVLNDNFIAIKVDREERPDIDQIYMAALQVLTGRGGWPMSVFLTPDGKPFHGGTYFPPAQFRETLARAARMYEQERKEVLQTAEEVVEQVAAMAGPRPRPAEGKLDRRVVRRALEVLHREFDVEHGGFGGAPKFPPHNGLTLFLHEYRGTREAGLLQMAARTLEAMALGGIHDQLGGGFHRYATDAEWLVPHFEEMLCDNALLIGNYVEAYALTKDPFFRAAAEDICAWVEREMTSPEGAFYTALDAESEGVEGKYYIWTRREILDLLGEDEGALFCRVYNVEEKGNYAEEATGRRTGGNILHLKQRLPQIAGEMGIPAAEMEARTAHARRKLLEARGRRVRPRRDDKVLTAWNGLMIGSLAYAGRALEEPRYVQAAERAARFVLDNLSENGRLLRRWRDGEAKYPGYLKDYVYLAQGLLELYEATGDRHWFERARELMDAAIAEFWDEADGGFFVTAERGERLFARPKDALDHPLPSGSGTAARVLLYLGEITGDDRYLDYVEETLHAFTPWMERAPVGTETLLLATSMYLERRPQPTAARPAASRRRGFVAEKHPVKLTATPSAGRVAPGESLQIKLSIEIAKGWHINSHRPLEDFLIPTAVAVKAGLPVEVGEIAYPQGTDIELAGDTLSVYEGTIELVAPLTVADDAQPGRGSLSLSLQFQACDDNSCQMPDRLEVDVPMEVTR